MISMNNKRRGFRVVLLLVLIALLAVGGYSWWRMQARQRAERAIKAGEDAYVIGARALEAGDGAGALPSLDEAVLHASQALDDLEQEQQAMPPGNEAGRACWLKARALRDQAFAKALASRQPLNLSEDTTTGVKFRHVLAIPDPQARTEAVGCLRQAALRLDEDIDVQQDALRTETTLQPLEWQLVERFSRNLVKLDPSNGRALYMLARFEFEQPARDARTGTFVPRLPEKRGSSRVVLALEHLNQLKKTKAYPVWRTLHLEAQVHSWLRDSYARHNKPDLEEKQDQALRALLPIVRAEGGKLNVALEQRAHLSVWDVEGVFALQLIALQLALQDAHNDGTDADKALHLLSGLLAFCQKVTAGDPHPIWLEKAAETALAAVDLAEPFMAADLPPQWTANVDAVQALAGKARDRKVATPALYSGVAELLVREGQLEGTRANAERQEQLRNQALQWVEAGLRVGKEAGKPPSALAELHARAGEMKVVQGEKRKVVAPHLQALQESKRDWAPAVIALLDGALAEREGRLGQARQSLERVLDSANPSLVVRAQLALAGVYMGLGQPDHAIATLNAADQAFRRFDQMSPQEKAWAQTFMGTPEAVTATLIIAHLETALLEATRHLKNTPGKSVPDSLLRSHEEAVQELRGKLKAPSTPDREAREKIIAYLTTTGRPDQARKELAALKKGYPASLDILRLEVALAVRADGDKRGKEGHDISPKIRAEVDGLIRKHLADHQGDSAAPLYWVEWLLRTGRSDQAVVFLKNPANIPGGKDERYSRALALALLTRGDREDGLAMLRHLPHHPDTDALLIQALGSVAEKEKELALAVDRHEANGLFRWWQGELALNKGKQEEAAAAFVQALPFTRVKPLARTGLQRALFALADANPGRAQTTAAQLLKEAAEEPALLLAYAYSCLRLDEIGEPRDDWDKTRNMASALNVWEPSAWHEGEDRAATALTRAEFWLVANRPDRARGEVARALGLAPKNAVAARLGLRVVLDSFEPELLAEGKNHLAILQEVQPEAPETTLFEARLQEHEGLTADAILTYERLLEKHPDKEGFARLVALLEKQGKKQQAHDWVQRWRKQLTDDPTAVRAEVRQLALSKQVDEASELAEKFRAQELKRVEKRLAQTKAPEGVSRQDWEKQQLRAAQNEVELELARGFLDGQAWTQAEKWVGRLLADLPTLPSAQLLLGDILLARQEWGRARDHYIQVLKQHKGLFIAANNLAWVLATRLNDPDQALRILQEVRKGPYSGKPISADRLNVEFLDTAGSVYEKLARAELYAEMRDLFETARRRYPRDPRMFLHLGNAYAGLEETAKATAMYTAAIALAGPQGRNSLSQAQRDQVIVAAKAGQQKLKTGAPQ
jgi:Tfp pilus assembly protein PilF